jgi:surface antigen
MGLGPSVGFNTFVEVKCIFSTMPEAVIFSKSSWIETEANRGHWGDLKLKRTRPVSSRCCRGVRLGFCTGASGQALRGSADRVVDRTRWCVRS